MLYWAIVAVVSVFIGRLYLLQVVKGDTYRDFAQANSVKDRKFEAPRGLVFDRKGRLLVGNRRSFDLLLDREHLRDPEAAAAWVSQWTGESTATIVERIKGKGPTWKPVTLARDLAFSQVACVEARREDVPGISIEVRIVREYPNGNVAAHVLGYVGEIDEKELGKPKFGHHRLGDNVGKGGIERSYDELLAGEPGIRRSIVNHVGREISTSLAQAPVAGSELHVALDLDVQRAAEEGLAGRRGAVVVVDVRTGGVIALASAPSYEPAAFVGGISSVRWKQLADDPQDPLRFRALAGTYPPGSVWKLLVSGAALQSGRHHPEFSVTCTGAMSIYNRVRHCWKETGHGTVRMREALTKSCNVYYYTAGRDVGLAPIEELGRSGGFGEVTGIDVPGERAGVLPGDAWKRRVKKEKWYPGDTINLAIGQGFLDVTPIQVAQFMMSIATGGDIRRMHVFDHAVDPATGEVFRRADPTTARNVPWKPETLVFLRDAMQGVVDQGTATRARIRGITIAGKTGTAQPSSGEAPKDMKREDRPERYQEHAWFAGFAPVEEPEVAFAIVLEHVGLHGGEAAAPIAHDILTAWFQDRLQVAGQ